MGRRKFITLLGGALSPFRSKSHADASIEPKDIGHYSGGDSLLEK
jgi:hypothetical protein